ncbi:hypothetical protein BDF19DRAFT_11881 [Syncephalis fuscata]|nr:hypothetical protein BDF19DRAFT_11881 [Syncephalis fuscata]
MWQPVEPSSTQANSETKTLAKEIVGAETDTQALNEAALLLKERKIDSDAIAIEQSKEPTSTIHSPRSSEKNQTPRTAVRIHRRSEPGSPGSNQSNVDASPLQLRSKIPSVAVLSPLSSHANSFDKTDIQANTTTSKQEPENSDMLEMTAELLVDSSKSPLMHNNVPDLHLPSTVDLDDTNNLETTALDKEAADTGDMPTANELVHHLQWPQRHLFTLMEERSKDLSSVCLEPAHEQDAEPSNDADHPSSNLIDEQLPPSTVVAMDRYLTKSEANSFVGSEPSVLVEESTTSVIIEESISQFGLLNNFNNQVYNDTISVESSPDVRLTRNDATTRDKPHYLELHTTPIRQQNNQREASYMSLPLPHWDTSPLHEASDSILTGSPAPRFVLKRGTSVEHEVNDSISIGEIISHEPTSTTMLDNNITAKSIVNQSLKATEPTTTSQIADEPTNLPTNTKATISKVRETNDQNLISVSAQYSPQGLAAFLLPPRQSSDIVTTSTDVDDINVPERPSTVTSGAPMSAARTPARRPLSMPAWQPASIVSTSSERSTKKEIASNVSNVTDNCIGTTPLSKRGSPVIDNIRKSEDLFINNDAQLGGSKSNPTTVSTTAYAAKQQDSPLMRTPLTSPRKSSRPTSLINYSAGSPLSTGLAEARLVGMSDRKQHLAQLTRRASALTARQSTASQGLFINLEENSTASINKSDRSKAAEDKPMSKGQKISCIDKD